MNSLRPLILAWMFLTSAAAAREFHVALIGNDANPGTQAAPLRTVQRAADLAQAGDVITVHAGVYRERVNPPRGGASESKRIVYQAAEGEQVELKGSELVKTWVHLRGDLWRATLPNSLFGSFNPYADLVHGDWFDPRGRQHHTGAVYLNGDWLTEAAKFEDLLQPAGNTPLWFGRVGRDSTTLWAQFKGVNPNEELVEINVRQTVFYPDQPGRNYLTVRGFSLSQAATPWAPPTAEQIGVIGTHWSKGWVIENNRVSYSICSGIALGKYGDEWDNTSANTAEGYVKTIQRALQHGWNRETIGHHIVRNNIISHCEQAGIVGSLGAAFSTISGNTIYDIHVRGLFSGAEMAGIKFHGAVDTLIRGNHIYHTCRGLWLDWMAQGTRVSGNLFHDNAGEDIFVEVDHGPFILDNNLLLSGISLRDMSEGGAYVQNLFAGRITTRPEPARSTPYLLPHATAVAGLATIKGGDDRFYDNIFIGNGSAPPATRPSSNQPEWISGFGLWVYDNTAFPLRTGGNVFYHGAQPWAGSTNALHLPSLDPQWKLCENEGHLILCLRLGPQVNLVPTRLVTTALLGKARVPKLPYQDSNGSALRIDRDYFGKRRGKKHPTPGPFEQPGTGTLMLKVW